MVRDNCWVFLGPGSGRWRIDEGQKGEPMNIWAELAAGVWAHGVSALESHGRDSGNSLYKNISISVFLQDSTLCGFPEISEFRD